MIVVAKQKIEMVDQLFKEISESRVVGIVSVHGIPGTQINDIRRTLRGKARIIMSKNTFIERALSLASNNKKGIENLVQYVADQTALILGNADPFKLAKVIDKSKTKAAAKGGEIAEENIEVHEGATQFKPGPIVSDFQKAGIPAGIEKGKVIIKKSMVVVPKGEVINKDLAQMLAKLEIFPVTVGLDLKAVYEDGTIYPHEALKIDVNKTMEDLILSATNARNLALSVGYVTKSTLPVFLTKAHMNAIALAVNSNVFSKESIALLLQKANLQMLALSKAMETK